MAALRLSLNGAPTNLAVVSDRQGSFLMAVDAGGAEKTAAGFYLTGPFGQRESGSAAATDAGTHAGLGFTGAGTPTTSGGYVYLRNRWYDPQTGRFLSQDPIGLAGGVNLYAYAGNNPIAYSDPFGLCPDPQDPKCQVFKAGMTLLGATAGFIVGGGTGVLETVVTGGLAAPVAVAQTAAATGTGAALGAAAGEALANILFSKSHTVVTTEVAGHGTVRVDWEEPTGDRPGNVHVQGKGKNALGRIVLESIKDLRNLPKAVRNNPTIQQGVKKAFDMLERFSQ